MVWLLVFQLQKQLIQGALVLFILLSYLRTGQQVGNHFKVLLIRRSLMEQIEHQGGIQCNFRFFPEGVRVICVLGRGISDQIVHQLQYVGLVADIGEGIIAVRLAGVDQVEHHDFISLFFQQVPGGPQQLSLGVCDNVGAVCAVKPWLGHKTGLAGAGAAHHNDVEVAPVLVAVEADRDVLGQDHIGQRIFFIHVLLAESLGVAPSGGAILLSWPAILPGGIVQANAAAVTHQTDQHNLHGVWFPLDGERTGKLPGDALHQGK